MKTYKVVGVQPTLGHAPGEQFDADISPEQEAQLICSNAIKVVERTTTDYESRKRAERR